MKNQCKNLYLLVVVVVVVVVVIIKTLIFHRVFNMMMPNPYEFLGIWAFGGPRGAQRECRVERPPQLLCILRREAPHVVHPRANVAADELAAIAAIKALIVLVTRCRYAAWVRHC